MIVSDKVYERKVDALGRAYATGKRKNSVARVWVKSGSGAFTVNGKRVTEYFDERPVFHLSSPLSVLESADKFDVFCTVAGGGFTGQSGAIRHGLSRALVNFDPAFRPALKSAGLLVRDSRVVEPKKYGRLKARKSFPYVKR